MEEIVASEELILSLQQDLNRLGKSAGNFQLPDWNSKNLFKAKFLLANLDQSGDFERLTRPWILKRGLGTSLHYQMQHRIRLTCWGRFSPPQRKFITASSKSYAGSLRTKIATISQPTLLLQDLELISKMQRQAFTAMQT